MDGSRRKTWGAGAIAALAVAGLLAAWHRTSRGTEPEPDAAPQDDAAESDPGPPPDADTEPAPRAAPSAAPVPEEPEEQGPTPAPQAREAAPEERRLSISHTLDPCRPVASPTVPSDFGVLTVEGITLAWPPGDAPIAEPTAFAYLVAGLLEEAALLTGTERRERLTVFLYPSLETFRKQTGARSWSDGRYDGAVHVPALGARPFGVRLRTLRHELMHAQLHAGAGCTPLWLNEGVAMRFGGQPPYHEWLKMLRERRFLDIESLEVSTIDHVLEHNVDLLYAQSLAMVLFMEDRSESGIEDAVAAAAATPRKGARAGRRSLWNKLYPTSGASDVLSSLARRIFKMSLGPELDTLFQESAVCCYGTRTIAELGCRGAPRQPGKHFWIDDSREPYASCEVD